MKPGLLILLCCGLLLPGCLTQGGGGPTPTPTPVTTFTPAQLKYILLDHYGESRFFFCDPDYFPVARGDELERAVETLPSIENETDVFSAITARKGLHPPYSDDTKLVFYREYKKHRAIPLEPAGDGTFSFSLQLGTMGEGRRVTGIIGRDGIISGEQYEPAILTCPICLPAETQIDTPEGPVKVKDIRIGMMVWTPGLDGSRRAVPVVETVKTVVPAFHHLIHLTLADGRELDASAGHPTMDGRLVGTLTIGDMVDQTPVLCADPIPCTGEFTYDILPAGETGGYWANGIPLKSTLFQAPVNPL